MRVGVAVREIPVPPGTALGGYARRTALARGMARPLTVRAVTIASDGGDAVVLLVYDLLTVTRDLSMLVRAILAPEVDPAHVLTAATHTHCAPRDLTMESHAALVTSLAELGADAAREALDHAVAVRLVAGTTASLGVGRNRRVATLPVDDHATVVLAERLHADNHPTGEVVATLVNFACHPTTLGPDMTDAHPDYPGHLRATVEAGLGGVCVFLQGFAGSTNPVVAAGTADADRVGLAVAGPVLTLAAQLRAVGRRATFVSLSEGRNLPARIADGCEHTGPVRAARRMVSVTPRPLTVPDRPVALPTALAAERWITDLQHEGHPVMHSMDPLPATDELEVQCFRLGDTLEVVALPGEPLESGRDRIVSARPGRTVLTVGYANAAPGYLPASSDYPHAGYEVGMSRYAAGTLEALCDAAVTLAQDLSAQRD